MADEVPTPWQRASTTRRSRKSEEAGAKLEGGRRVPRSGAGREKGDIKAGLFLIEDKYTDNDSYSITQATLDKLVVQSFAEHRLWQMRIRLPRYQLRVLLESDYLYLQAMAAKAEK